MLSALIPSAHSYPALQLVLKPVHQRCVQPGPLVTLSSITRSVDYIFTPLSPLLQTEPLSCILIPTVKWERGSAY